MFSILPCSDEHRLKDFPENATLLIYKDNDIERGHIAYCKNQSAFEILSMETGVEPSPDGSVSDELFIHADALIRSVGAIALGEGILTLCTKREDYLPLLEKFGFFIHGDYYILYLSKLFSKGCSGCKGCSAKKE